jgi:FlaA1/EpsC-like NDP-sugar epimerase
MSRIRRLWKPQVVQAVAIIGSLISSWLLRFEFRWEYTGVLWRAIPVLLIARFTGLFLFQSLHGYWRYTGAADLMRIAKATLVGSVIFIALERGVLGVTAFPLSIYVIELVFTTAALIAARAIAVMLFNGNSSQARGREKKLQACIVGAGFAGNILAKEMRGSNTGLHLVGFVDDDRGKRGSRIQGLPVLGTIEELEALVPQRGIDELLIAIPSASKGQLNRIVRICANTKVKFRSVPSLSDILSGKMAIDALKDTDVDDLIGRDKVELDLAPVRAFLGGKIVLVTGAAGSIGSELCRQILQCGPEKLICIDRDETALFHLGASLEALTDRSVPDSFVLQMADVADAGTMRKVLRENQVQVIFHAAAYKHVPLVEANVAEAVKNNVIALWKLLDMAEESGCDRFVLISSDKAVNPSSFMGCTKRIGELLVASRPSSRLKCMSVRFGNVLGSQGSVVPTFKSQIARGKAITVTHPEMTRFFMAISEAVSLVLQASVIGGNGEIYVLNMGEPIKIVELAKMLMRLSGKSEADIPIQYTGLRPGEKLYEELFYEDEGLLQTPIDGLRVARGRVVVWNTLRSQLVQLTRLLDESAVLIRQKVKEIVPEYQQPYALEPETNETSGLLRMLAARSREPVRPLATDIWIN